jgi:oligopeptide/dipeptide ABC transporter ATP-binding protein
MYAGRIVESGPTDEIFARPMHPYNAALQQSIPALHKKGQPLFTIPGLPPDLTIDFRGCPFASRCAHAADICKEQNPALKQMLSGHKTACIRFQRGEIADIGLRNVVSAV